MQKDEQLARRRVEGYLAQLVASLNERGRAKDVGPGPTDVEREELSRRLSAGPEEGEATRAGHPIEVVIGIDFGTSSTKVVARLPYAAGSPAFAVPVPPFAQAEAHPYLWVSRIWLSQDGIFSFTPLSGASVSFAIKAHLLSGGHTAAPVLTAGETAATAEEVAAAFLALQLRQTKGWLRTERAVVLRRGPIRWSVNFGFPAASLDDPALRSRYERCVAAALALAEAREEVSLADVRATFAAVAGRAGELMAKAGATLQPEIAAAVSGFANSTQLEDGLYTLVDVGGGTVDCCTFNLFKAETGKAKCPVFNARVEMLGVEPSRICAADGEAAKDFVYLLDIMQRRVIWSTKRTRDPCSERWRTGLPVFLVGGGAASDTHRASTLRLDGWLKENVKSGCGARVWSLPPPENLDYPLCSDASVHRLAVAIGLSFPEVEIPEVQLPADIDDVGPAARSDYEARYIEN
ncbi:hypothetical protein ACFQX4_17340 [Roseomonas sp. GCM10028921]